MSVLCLGLQASLIETTRTCVHRQDAVVTQERCDLLCKLSELVRVEGSAGEGELGGLVCEGLNDLRVAVACVLNKRPPS